MFCPQPPYPPYTIISSAISLYSLFTLWKTSSNCFQMRDEIPTELKWTVDQQKSFLLSIFRQSYIPRLVLREIRLDNQNIEMEIFDGRQRIQTLLDFYHCRFQLPCEIAELFPEIILNDSITDYAHEQYTCASIMFYPSIASFMQFSAIIHFDIIKGIDRKSNLEHERAASELYRLLRNH